MLPADSSCLEPVLLCLLLEPLLVRSLLRDVGELAQDGLPFASAHIGWTGGDDSINWVLCELNAALFHLGQQLVERSIDCPKVVAVHDRNDSELILLADPDHLGLVATEPDASTVGPVGSHSGRSEMVIGGHIVEEIVICPHSVGFLVADEVPVAWSEAVVSAADAELAEDLLHGVLEPDPLVLGHAGRQVPSLDVAGHSGSHGDALEPGVDAGEQIFAYWDVPVVELLGVALDAVILSDQGLQEEGEVVVVFGSGGVGSN